nr:MAG TPA: hypothetical protein [Caudoviricetes sp.]
MSYAKVGVRSGLPLNYIIAYFAPDCKVSGVGMQLFAVRICEFIT